ncbi:nudC domain-containing protein 3-like isoform X2 [Physella acuta]|uniref:nudC domain-containing protein 3-like isoform X2 n=1 Tax=Physella acuta TaxID=109671 RepID=UPI0027DDEA3B|nr:nudC domain-containing protein 3-like isoform X2 [Physella acuta]
MASDAEKYDAALLGILQNEGKVAPFLDVILGFLYRRTDFFRIMKADTDSLGFPPGIAFKLLENIFKKYESLAAKDSKRAEQVKKSREIQAASATENSQPVQMDITEDANVPPLEGEVKGGVSGIEETHSAERLEDCVEEKEKEDPELARQRRELQANPLTYNGAEYDAYFWSQTITEADVRVKVPKSVVKGRQVKVEIQKKHITVKKLEQDGTWSDLVNDDLSWEINMEDSMWTLNPGEYVHINLEKRQERWWENVFVGEPKINTQKIDCSRPMTDLDDEAQAKIEEMMYNQRQKQLGLPQSHETKTQEVLRKAWDAEGSPFKGQPFDPSRFNVDPNGIINFKDT